jgi:AraC-like DNA-binding protein
MSEISRSEPNGFRVDFDEGGSVARRKTDVRPDGLYTFEDDVDIKGTLKATIITCRAWLLELYEQNAGKITFAKGSGVVRPETDRFGVFYSPFSICQPCFEGFAGHVSGIAAIDPLPSKFLTRPVVFDVAFKNAPSSLSDVLETLSRGTNMQSIEIHPTPSLLTLKAKRIIDESYLINPSISKIAFHLKVTPEHLSRQFKNDFGMSPSNYLRRLRVADAPLRLAKGEKIVEVSQDVGYNDLSRFYKQFRKTTETSPGECKTMLRSGRRRTK